MTTEIIAAAGVIGTFAFSVGGIVWKAGSRISKLEDRVDVLWKFLIERGVAEAIHKGIAKRNSPIEIDPTASEWITPLMEDLKRIVTQQKKPLSESSWAHEIEKHFGKRIVNEVCVPNGISAGACLVILIDALRKLEPEKVKADKK